MTTNEDKTKVLIVGGFPPENGRKIYGGQVAACMSLLNSTFTETHIVRTIDTTQISNPPPVFIIRMFLALKRLIMYCVEIIIQKPDVAIIFLADRASAIEKGLMTILSRVFRTPVMVFPRAGSLIHSYSSNRLFASFIRNTLGQADIFLCQGAAFQTFATKKLGFTKYTAPIIPNWTASNEHLEIGAQRNYDTNKSCLNVLFIGWLEEYKGVFDLLEACHLLHSTGVNLHLILCGDGNAMPKAQHFVELSQLSKTVTFAGWVNKDEKKILLRSSDIFVLPSWSEGLPNSMIEAMCSGLACIVSDVGTISDYVVDGRDALVVKPHDANSIAEALKTLITDNFIRKDIAINGHELAKHNFTLENGVKLLSAIIYQVNNKNQLSDIKLRQNQN